MERVYLTKVSIEGGVFHTWLSRKLTLVIKNLVHPRHQVLNIVWGANRSWWFEFYSVHPEIFKPGESVTKPWSYLGPALIFGHVSAVHRARSTPYNMLIWLKKSTAVALWSKMFHTLLTASHSFRSSPGGNLTTVRKVLSFSKSSSGGFSWCSVAAGAGCGSSLGLVSPSRFFFPFFFSFVWSAILQHTNRPCTDATICLGMKDSEWKYDIQSHN